MLSASLAVILLVLLIWLSTTSVVQRMVLVRRVLVLGSGSRAVALRHRLSQHAIFRSTGSSSSNIWGVVVAEDDYETESLWDIKLRGVPVFDDLIFQEKHLGRIALDAIDEHWLLFGNMLHKGIVRRISQRAFDLVFSSLMIVLLAPLMMLFGILIKLESRGPIFYLQERVGLNNKPFIVFKFRSMRKDAEASGVPQWAAKADPRITRIGGFMRACRIDELPQLINVIRGEMSIIGPRPERPAIVAELSKFIPFFELRGQVKPGLTGWAQVSYPYGASVEDAREKFAYDLYYIKNSGFRLNLLILISTIRVIVMREGAR